MAPTLRITHSCVSPEQHKVDLALMEGAAETATASASFDFVLDSEDQEALRWYWEDYLEYAVESASDIAAEIEGKLAALGLQLFQSTFPSGAAQDLWRKFQPQLSAGRVEVITREGEGSLLPWELLRDAATQQTLATTARSFVRKPAGATAEPGRFVAGEAPLRVLTVICRPPSPPATPFRSPAALLVKTLRAPMRESVQWEVLRPPTFGQLGSVLQEAEAVGEPFHVLHIDGYGVYGDIELEGTPEEILEVFSQPQLTSVPKGPHGYLVFDSATLDNNVQLVDGTSLGALMREARVPVLTLNLCRVARNDFRTEPDEMAFSSTGTLRAFHSLSHDVLEKGVRAAVHLPYSIDALKAAEIFGSLYSDLARGLEVGASVTRQRKALREQGDRQIGYGPVRLEDWATPVAYELEPLAPVRPGRGQPALSPLQLTEALSQPALGDGDRTPKDLPLPSAGRLFGRDETLLAIDRAFRNRSVVLLEGEAGMGKTATAGQFAAWYALTEGFDGPVLFTSFDRHKTVAAVLDQVAVVFREALESADYRWISLPPEERFDVALHVLNQIPVLWIWDNVERVAGFPQDQGSSWTVEEQEELANFLRLARETQAKFLLLSRPVRSRWLGEFHTTLELPPLPMRERLQLTRSLAERDGYALTDVDNWEPILEFSQGNPLAIHGLAQQTLRQGLESGAQVRNFVEQLKSGAASFSENGPSGVAPHLSATIDYVLDRSFGKPEQSIMALLHLFGGAASVPRLLGMFGQEDSSHLPELTRLKEFQELKDDPEFSVLDRAASFGLLAKKGKDRYSIHEAFHWFLEKLFAEHYPEHLEPGSGRKLLSAFGRSRPESPPKRKLAVRSFVEELSRLGSRAAQRVEQGDREAIGELAAEESNLLQAIELARQLDWWGMIAGCVEGLGALYESAGRIAEWESRMEGLRSDCVDKSSQGALPGREEFWRAVTEQGVRIARRRGKLPRAEELQRLCVNSDRGRAELCLEVPSEALSQPQRATLEKFAQSLYQLGEILRAQGFPESKIEEEAVSLRERLGEREKASAWALSLGSCYRDDLTTRDLTKAERWLRRSLDLKEEEDNSGRASCFCGLAQVAWERFGEARKTNRPQVELVRHLNDARTLYMRAIDHEPAENWSARAQHNQQLGHICFSLGDLDRALPYYRESIRYHELQENPEAVAETRFSLAMALRDANRLAEARRYAQEAHNDFQKLPAADPEIRSRAERLVNNIEQRLQVKKQVRAG